MKRSGPTHFKTERLMASLSMTRYEAVGILELLWHFTDEHAQDGNLSRFRPADITSAMGWHGSPEDLVDALVEAGFLDRPGCCEQHKLILHDRADHAQEFIRKAVIDRRKSSFVVPCPPPADHQEPSSDNGSQRQPLADDGLHEEELTGNAASASASASAQALKSESEIPPTPSTESEQSPRAPRRPLGIFDEGRRTGEVSDSVDQKVGSSDSDFGVARSPPQPPAPDPRAADQLANELAALLRIQPLHELQEGSRRRRQAQTDRQELATKICPAILSTGNGSREWACEQAKQSATADRPMAVFKRRLQKAGMIKRAGAKPRK